jgi:hypothetical protein
MPGRYPGRVVEVHHPGAVNPDYEIDGSAVRAMMERGMCSFTGADHYTEAWKTFFEPGDVVGIKVNPVGHNRGKPQVRAAITSPEVLIEVVRGLKAAGVKPGNIIVFERYAEEFIAAGYDQVMSTRPLDGVRWCAASTGYSPTQLEIDGVSGGRSAHSPELLRHVVGYDPDAFVTMGFAAPEHDPKDDRRHRSHLSLVVSRLVNKFVTIPVLKDHRSAGVTLALKTLSHGLNNNVARSHLSGIAHGFPDSPAAETTGPNQCNTFIPTAVNQPATRQKATLHVLDGLVGVYEGGPGSWNRTWATWRAQSLFFATDPVALDHVGWDVIDAKRLALGWARVAEMGLNQSPGPVRFAGPVGALAGLGGPLAALAPAAAARQASGDVEGGRGTEVFDRRQPEHIYLAGSIGLGTFDPRQITHRRERL